MLSSAELSAKVIPLPSSLFPTSSYWQFFLETTAQIFVQISYGTKNLLGVNLFGLKV